MLIVEAVAQVSAVIILMKEEESRGKVGLFAWFNLRLKKQVHPGD